MFRIILTEKAKEQLLTIAKKESNKMKVIKKIIDYLSNNTRHPSLKTHKFIGDFEGIKSRELFEAYVENRTPGAYRIFWCYGKEKDTIVIISVRHHI